MLWFVSLQKMNNLSSNLYNVGLLDDLHKYFPDLLYNPSRFHNVQDVLSYIQTQTRSRFNLYDYGLSQQQGNRQNVVIQPSETGTTTANHNPQCTCRDCMPTIRTPTQRARQVATNPPPVRRVSVSPFSSYNFYPPIDSELIDSTNILTSLLSLASSPPLQTIPLGTTFLNSMENVIVRPSLEQINAASTVFNMPTTPDISDTTCTVCQDTMEPSVPVRRLNTCHHQFHKSCIDTWFERSVRCPVCRRDIRDLPTE